MPLCNINYLGYSESQLLRQQLCKDTLSFLYPSCKQEVSPVEGSVPDPDVETGNSHWEAVQHSLLLHQLTGPSPHLSIPHQLFLCLKGKFCFGHFLWVSRVGELSYEIKFVSCYSDINLIINQPKNPQRKKGKVSLPFAKDPIFQKNCGCCSSMSSKVRARISLNLWEHIPWLVFLPG